MNHAKETEIADPLSDDVVNLRGGYVGSEDGNEGKRLVEAMCLFGRNVENDWWQYVPRRVDPTRAQRERWLVRRIWDLCTVLGLVRLKWMSTNQIRWRQRSGRGRR